MEEIEKKELATRLDNLVDSDYTDQVDAATNVTAELKGMSEQYGIPSKILRKYVVAKYKDNKDEYDSEKEILDELWDASK